jgi:membrane-bound lytic murein transglycosylase D
MRIPAAFVLVVLTYGVAVAAEPAKPPPAASAGSDTDELYDLGKQLFEQYAPAAVKEQYEFPSKAQWDVFAGRLQDALNSDSLQALAGYAPQARAALSAARTLGVDEDLADWLEQRLDEAEGAQEAVGTAPPPPSPVPPAPHLPRPTPPTPTPPAAPAPDIPHYRLWLARVQTRPLPPRASELMPTLRSAFSAEGVPPALAWLAEAESSFNPSARSPAGAKGLFQLMPDTARNLGLDTFLPDERTNPEKSARAAARYLRNLHEKFGDWPLTLAAYNAGEGRVSRALTARKARDFASIADALPAETRMYVPKVCALVAVRSGRPITSW